MTRRDRDIVRRFPDRYSLPVSHAALAIEREVIGANVGAAGYTTLAQADALIPELRLQPGALLLDLGAGRDWALADAPAPGLAAAPKRADEAALSGRAAAIRAGAQRLPFRPRVFDAVV